MPNIEVYQRADKRWAWRLRAGNGSIIATDGGQGYENRADAARMADAITSGLSTPTTAPTPPNASTAFANTSPGGNAPTAPTPTAASSPTAIRAIIDPPENK